MDVRLLPEERVDDLMFNGLRIIQKEKGFCFGMDAVLLAGFVRAKNAGSILDLGTGTGVIALLLAGRYPTAKLTALEIQPEMAEMAERSVKMNDLTDRVSVVCGDLCKHKEILPPSQWDVVTCNPPYARMCEGTCSAREHINLSRHEAACTLEDVVAAGSYALNNGGRMALVIRSTRTTDLFCALRANRLEPKRARLVCSRIGARPKLMLIEAIKGGASSMEWEPPLIVYDEQGSYTPELLKIYHMDGTEKT